MSGMILGAMSCFQISLQSHQMAMSVRPVKFHPASIYISSCREPRNFGERRHKRDALLSLAVMNVNTTAEAFVGPTRPGPGMILGAMSCFQISLQSHQMAMSVRPVKFHPASIYISSCREPRNFGERRHKRDIYNL